MPERALVRLGNNCEEVASGLHVFRDSLPRHAAQITLIIAEFFAISSTLRRLDAAERDPRYQPSFYRIRDDVGLLIGSLQASIDDVLDMFGRSRGRPRQMVWEDLQHQMDDEEGESLLGRLQLYKNFLITQASVVAGRRPSGVRELRLRLHDLVDGQEGSRMREQAAETTASSTPRPQATRPFASPTSSAGMPNLWDERPPPAPDPPLGSPTFTSSSSQTLGSSQTSYSNEPMSPTSLHWAQDVHNGTNPMTPFRTGYMLAAPSSCHGSVDPYAFQQLAQDRFTRLLQLPFDRDRLIVSFYWRGEDKRARIHVLNRTSSSDQHHCIPMSSLKAIRDKSCIQLCRAGEDGRYFLWCRLNFATYERMVIFYCTFVAMKHQDERGIPDGRLLDHSELKADSENGEVEMYGGVVKHGAMRHGLRLYRDRASSGVRLEVSALRGPMEGVPIWTAFATKYADDPDWPHYEGDGLVSLAALKPPPYMFLSGYEPPRNGMGEYLLQFETGEDGRQFVENWAGLCRSQARR